MLKLPCLFTKNKGMCEDPQWLAVTTAHTKSCVYFLFKPVAWF